jgi:hypothetical protein
VRMVYIFEGGRAARPLGVPALPAPAPGTCSWVAQRHGGVGYQNKRGRGSCPALTFAIPIGGGNMKRFAIGLMVVTAGVICGASSLAAQSTDNTLYIKQFPGADVGTKITNAMAACNPNPAVPCILVIDPSLAGWTPGTMPALCPQCVLSGYRAAIMFTNLNKTCFAQSAMELGAQITSFSSSGCTNIVLAPFANYTMTKVATAGIGVFIDGQGSTVTANYALGDLIRWDNTAAWTNAHSQFIHPATGIADIKFTPGNSVPTGNTTMRVGYVGAISHFVARNVTVNYGGAFELVGPSITGTYDAVRVIDPTTPNVWQFTTGSGPAGWFGPNGNQIRASYCEGVSGSLYAGQSETCVEADGGSVNIADSYFEAFGRGVHVNGGTVTMHHTTANTRAFSGAIFVVDSGTLNVDGINVTMGGDTAGDDMTFLQYNASGFPYTPPVGVSNITVSAMAYPGTSILFSASNAMTLNLGGQNGIYVNGAQVATLFKVTGSGGVYDSTVTGFNVIGTAGSTTNFSAGTTVFSDTTIASSTFLRTSNFVGLGQGTNLIGNTFAGGPVITFASGTSTALTGNVFDGGVPTVTLNGAQCMMNTGYSCQLPSAMTAVTQAAGDNSTKLATTAYAQNPGAITPATVAVASARRGTFACTAGGTISVTNSNLDATSDVTITLKKAGGTITTPPAMKTMTPGTGFSVMCGASDTSVYNYTIWN